MIINKEIEQKNRDKNLLIFIPTYNEKENVRKICEDIITLNIRADILFMDDNSPDGTGGIINELTAKYRNVYAIHRLKKLGIGNAHQEGIKWAYKNKYGILITMDCDFTHHPGYIRYALNTNFRNYDIVVGSRYISKNSLEGWNILRKILTLSGHIMTKYLLRLKYDATGAFRLYRLDNIPEFAFERVSSKGYSFFFESLYILNFNHFSIKEIPIILSPRTYGHSKMKFRDAWHSLEFLFKIYLTSVFNKRIFEISENIESTNCLEDINDWDSYWEKEGKIGGSIYDAIAVFYRRFIIKGSLNYFIKKYFNSGSKILHAGCGSGQVDVDIKDHISIIALDISRKALNLYKGINENHNRLLNGNIFNIPLRDNSVDGIYNLGVMEHFTEPEIKKILLEFERILRPGGRIIIFWPPEFGLSVLFLKVLKPILKNVFKKDIKLHPDEPTLVKSEKHIKSMINSPKLSIIDYYFGMKDFFTYTVIVAEKSK